MKARLYNILPQIYWFSVLIILLAASSCKSNQAVLKNETVATTVKKDCTAVFQNIEKTNAISDQLNLFVPDFKTGSKCADCDSLCNARKAEWLKSVNSQKTSGKNELGFKYDALNNLLVAYGKLDESNKVLIEKYQSNLKHESVKEVKQIPVKLPLNKWEKFLCISGLLAWAYIIGYAIGRLYKFYKNINPLT